MVISFAFQHFDIRGDTSREAHERPIRRPRRYGPLRQMMRQMIARRALSLWRRADDILTALPMIMRISHMPLCLLSRALSHRYTLARGRQRCAGELITTAILAQEGADMRAAAYILCTKNNFSSATAGSGYFRLPAVYAFYA